MPVIKARYWLALGIAATLFVLLSVLVHYDVTTGYDINVLAYFAGQLTPALTGFFRAATWAGSIIVLAPLAAVIGYLFARQGRRADAMLLFYSLALAAVASRLLKYLVDRARPDAYPALVDTYTGLAFPSVHATQVTAFCLVLLLVVHARAMAWRLPVGLLLLAVMLCVSSSRLYLQVHYPSDVLGGILLGIACVMAVAMLQATPKTRP